MLLKVKFLGHFQRGLVGAAGRCGCQVMNYSDGLKSTHQSASKLGKGDRSYTVMVIVVGHPAKTPTYLVFLGYYNAFWMLYDVGQKSIRPKTFTIVNYMTKPFRPTNPY